MQSKEDNHHIFSHYKQDDTEDEYQESSQKCSQPDCFIDQVRNSDGSLKLRNPHLQDAKDDFLYHLGFGADFCEKFSDVKFVCMGGTPQRMKTFAHYVAEEINVELPPGGELEDLTVAGQRYAMFKVGPVLSVSHGMGISSLSILLHEIIKLLAYARVKNPVFFRIGTCGGLGVKPGTVVVSDDAVDGMLCRLYQRPILGKLIGIPAILDKHFAQLLKDLSKPEDDFEVVNGGTMCASDFYEEQGRLDGAFCNFTLTEKMEYLKHLRENGVVNIEMESVPFAAMTFQAGIRAADVCVTFLDRLQGDQVLTPKSVLTDWQKRPQVIVGRYIKEYLRRKGCNWKH